MFDKILILIFIKFDGNYIGRGKVLNTNKL